MNIGYFSSLYCFLAILFFFLTSITLSKSSRTQKLILWGVFFPVLVIYEGLRWETGNDWTSYMEYFANCMTWDTRMEIGYTLLNKAIYYVFGNNYSIFLLITSIIFYWFVLNCLYKYSSVPLLSSFLFFCGYLGFLGTNRQLLAFAICLFSIRFIIEKNTRSFIICVVLASSFHLSAVIWTFVYFINKFYNKKIYYILLFSAIILSLLGFLESILTYILSVVPNSGYLFSQFDNYHNNEVYNVENVTYISLLFPLLRRFVFFFLSINLSSSIIKNNKNFPLFFNMYFIFILIYILFYGSSLQIVVGRVSIYFIFSEFIIIAELLSLLKNMFFKYIFSFICFLYGVILIVKVLSESEEKFSNNLFYPYKSLYYNVDIKRTMW